MSEKHFLEKIWFMQADLNRMVGVDTLDIGANASERLQFDWIRRYYDQFQNEIFETKQNFYHKWWVKEIKEGMKQLYDIKDLAKIKLELIDALHFLISTLQCQNFKLTELIEEFQSTQKNLLYISHSNFDLYHSLSRLCQADYSHSDKAFRSIFLIFNSLQMTNNEILQIYKLKWETNVQRQKNNYSEETKTEIDNEIIEKKILDGFGC